MFFKKSTLPTDPTVEPLTPEETAYIAQMTSVADKVLAMLQGDQSTHRYHPDRIAAIIQAYIDGDATLQELFGGENANLLSNALASAWGTYLQEVLGLSWYVIDDKIGTNEIGLYGQANNLIIYPFQVVAKAFSTSDSTIITAVTSAAAEQI